MDRFISAQPQPYYPKVTNTIIALFQRGELPKVVKIEVEPDYGYTMRLTYTDGSVRITFGYNLGVNAAAATHLAKDKGYSKKLFRSLGVTCPDGSEFMLPWWHAVVAPGQQSRGNPAVRSTAEAPT